MSQKSLANVLKAVDVVTVVCVCVLAAYAIPRVMGVLIVAGALVVVGTVAFALPLVVMGAAAWGVSSHIGAGASFCVANVRLLRAAALASAVESVLFFIVAGSCAFAASLGLALGLGAFGLLFVSGAVCLIVLSRLTRHAAQIKDENDLTV